MSKVVDILAVRMWAVEKAIQASAGSADWIVAEADILASYVVNGMIPLPDATDEPPCVPGGMSGQVVMP